MSKSPIQNANLPAATVVELPKNTREKPGVDGQISDSLLQQVVDKYANQVGLPQGETAEDLGVTVVSAGTNQDTGEQSYAVLTNVSGGNGQNTGLDQEPPSASGNPPGFPNLPPAGTGLGGNEMPTLEQYQGDANFQAAVHKTREDPSNAADAIVNFGLSASFKNKNVNVNALIQLVLREAYQGNNKDLMSFAQQVEFYNNVKEQLRNNEDAVNNFIGQNLQPDGTLGGAQFEVPSDPSTQYVGDIVPRQTMHDFSTGAGPGAGEKSAAGNAAQGGAAQGGNAAEGGAAGGNAAAAQPGIIQATDGKPAVLTTVNAMNDYSQSIDSTIQNVGGDQQMAQLRLQSLSQNQATLVQDMSNLSKSVYDTMAAVIRNIQT